MSAKSTITFEVAEVEYRFGGSQDAPTIVLQLTNLAFADPKMFRPSFGGQGGPGAIWLYLTKSEFYEIAGRFWDGSREGVEKVKPHLLNKVFQLPLSLRPSNELGALAPTT